MGGHWSGGGSSAARELIASTRSQHVPEVAGGGRHTHSPASPAQHVRQGAVLCVAGGGGGAASRGAVVVGGGVLCGGRGYLLPAGGAARAGGAPAGAASPSRRRSRRVGADRARPVVTRH